MGLSDFKVNPSVAVSDLARAREFYEGKLGLASVESLAGDSEIYASGGGSSLHTYLSPDNAGSSTATLATWQVDDVERMVDELSANGVAFEHYEGLTTDGISPTPDGGKVAWFKDPDGNTFAIESD